MHGCALSLDPQRYLVTNVGVARQILVRTSSKCALQPKFYQHLPVAAAGSTQAEGRNSHPWSAADPGDWNLANFVSKQEGLQSGFGIGGKAGADAVEDQQRPRGA
jgi:hypothetical protein